MKILSALMIALASLIPAAQAATTTADLKQFSKIAVSAPIDLDVSVGGKAAFTMTGRADDLAKIIATVKDDTLILKQRKHSGRMEKVTVTIATKQLKQYTVNGSSDAKIRGINGLRPVI
ncbi:MAG: hypothetical protein GXP02_08105 [Alphaproteobacteria bacterium]|nr:hypothetical protein [Alphaproteobacteria bacterium]